jgi:hypothetical protein
MNAKDVIASRWSAIRAAGSGRACAATVNGHTATVNASQDAAIRHVAMRSSDRDVEKTSQVRSSGSAPELDD